MARILLLTQRLHPEIGGLARSGTRVACALTRLGHRVDVVAWSRQLPAGERERQPGTSLHPSLSGLTLHRIGLFANWDLSLLHTQIELERLHADAPFDLVWGHYLFPPGFMAVLFAQEMQIPVTVSARGNDLDQAIYPPGDFARLLWTLQRSTLISAVSQDFARKIQCLLGTTTPITVLPNAVDLEVFSPAPPDMELRKSLGIRDEEAVLVFSGELRHKKGAVHLLSSFRWVHAQRPACLLLVGEIRAREQELLTRFKLEAPEAAQRILLTGHLEQPSDVARHLRLADLFLLPALWDGLPNALVEAMACGCLVLGSDAGGLPELLRHDQNGCVLPRTELQHLGPAVLEALALHPERKIELCRQARLDVERDFSPRAEEAALNEFVQLLLK